MVRITPVHDQISPRFPVASFAISAPSGRPFEIACAADPRLFGGDLAHLRRDDNFFTSRSRGWLLAPYGRAHYVLPPDVVARFLAAWRLYYVLAVYDSMQAQQAVFSVPPGALADTPFLRISRDLAATSLGRVRPPVPRPSPGAVALSWGGDQLFARPLGGSGAADGGHAGGPACQGGCPIRHAQ
jgi:hypothetical protein